MRYQALLFVGAVALAASPSVAAVYTVPGTSNPYLSGAPDGTTASLGDVAPDQSPVEAVGLGVAGGVAYTFHVTGSVSNVPSPSGLSPDGGAIFSHSPGAQNGISQITAPINSLVGVFLDNRTPAAGDEAAALDFSTAASRSFASLSPLLNQLFFIGDGRDDDGAIQSFLAPTASTRLFLGTMDGFGWFNNSGAFEVKVAPVPLPAPAALLLVAIAAIAAVRRIRT